ncbi:unnamed protein product, partial [Laminaria digitata]
ISDSEGGVTKTYARNKATNMSWRVTGPRDLCAKLGMDLDFKLREATDEEREIFYADPTHVRRSGQILMTKISRGDDGTEMCKTLLIKKNPNTLCGR